MTDTVSLNKVVLFDFDKIFFLADLLYHLQNLELYVPAHDKTYNKTCTTSEDSEQPAYPRSLIRIFADRMCFLQLPGYPKRDEQNLLPYWVDVQADLSLSWSHRSYCRFCRALA